MATLTDRLPGADGSPLDVEALARLANELYREWPGTTAVAPPPLDAPRPDGGALTSDLLAAPIPGIVVPRLDVTLPTLGIPRSPPAVVTPGSRPADPYSPLSTESPRFYFADFARGAVPQADSGAHPPFDVHAVRRDFPLLEERIHGRPLVWLDNGATTQKPRSVIERLAHFYEHENSNVHRGAHTLAARATDAYESARATVARFLGAPSADSIVFVRGATEAINLVAKSWGARNVGAGDEILVTHLEHHANIVPWQQLAEAVGARLRVAPVDDRGELLVEAYTRLLGPKTRLVAITHVANAIGTVTPVKTLVELAHRVGALALVDGAQSVSHMPVNVQTLEADFFVFSGHKVFGPTGIGALYGRPEILETMPPWQSGGNMIEDVTFEATRYQPFPARFEAGTGNIADAAGLAAALEYLERLGMANIERYERELFSYALRCLEAIPGLTIVGHASQRAAVLSFVLAGHSPEEVGRALDAEGIAVRAGHHCAQPILRRLGYEATVRASLALYNTRADVDALARSLRDLAPRRAVSPIS